MYVILLIYGFIDRYVPLDFLQIVNMIDSHFQGGLGMSPI